MEIFFSASKHLVDKRDWFRDEKVALALSIRNVVAFSCTQKLIKSSSQASSQNIQYYVYVCDLDKPWEVFLVTRQDEKIICLEWDSTGSRLLIGGGNGHSQVWRMEENMLNQWHLDHRAAIQGEEIILAAWLHPGMMYSLNLEKKDSVLYSEKYTTAKFSPSASLFGGGFIDGWIVLSATGLVNVYQIKNDNSLHTVTDALSLVRSQVIVADLAYAEDGKIHIATSDGIITSPIQIHVLNLTFEKSYLVINIQEHCGLFSKSIQEKSFRDSTASSISHVKFLSPEKVDSIILCSTNSSSSILELWTLREAPIAIHRSLTTNGTQEKSCSMIRWAPIGSLTHNSVALALTMPKFQVVQNASDTSLQALQYIAVSFKDRSVKLISKSGFQFQSSCSIDEASVPGDTDAKTIVALEQLNTGCGIVGIDIYGTLSLFRAVNFRDVANQVPPYYIISLLEYKLVSGHDWWDVFLLLRPSMIDTIVTRLTDHFNKQPQSIKEFNSSRFIALKSSLYRLNASSSQKAADCLAESLLNSISNMFKSLLRPKNLNDKGPAERLSLVCSKSTEIDQVLINLETKDFIVLSATLQTLQQLIQWVADFALNLVISIPSCQTYSNHYGTSLLYNSSALVTLRELLVVIRIWGLIQGTCMPVFNTSANLDSCNMLAKLFKIITKVLQTARDGNVEFDEILIDECNTLNNQVSVPNIYADLASNDLGTSGSSLNMTSPAKFIYSDVPDSGKRSQGLFLDSHGPSASKRDCIRQLFMGKAPANKAKQCMRCGNLSLLEPVSKSVVVKIWEHRWTKLCICGGQWKLANVSKKNGVGG